MSSFYNRVNSIVLWTDMVIISVSFLITSLTFNKGYDPSVFVLDLLLWTFLLAGWYFTARQFNLYDASTGRSLPTTIVKTGKNILYQAFFIAVFLFVAKHSEYSRRFAFLYISLLCLLLPLQKLIYKKVLIFFVNQRSGLRRVLIIGAGKVGMDFYKIITNNTHLGYEVAGFLDDQPQKHLNGQHLGRIDEIEDFLRIDGDLDEIVVALPNAATEQIKHVINAARNETVRVRIIPDYFHYFSSKYGVSMLEGLPIITLRREPLEEYHWRMVKRMFDLVFSSFILVFVCSWLFPMIALCIKLESKGPVFFTQLRTGRNKKAFNCLKFRSMQVNDDADSRQASKNDSRFTKVGSFLRKTNLDEFPQFINVLKGEMSVVGPRPHMLKQTEEYGRMIDKYLVRHLLKSGVTGWAQVNGFRGETREPKEMQGRVEHDVFYLENWSMFFDLKIIFLTLWNMFKGDKKAF
jgi:putative colanic acid biosysnthesis UDP-glucose lipid carrier transferase